jgi:hypothetical protein
MSDQTIDPEIRKRLEERMTEFIGILECQAIIDQVFSNQSDK